MKEEKKETTKVAHSINHRFVCEHCNEQSDWITTVIKGNTKEEILNNRIPIMQEQIKRGNYDGFNSLLGCQRCGKQQSWGLKVAKGFVLFAPIGGILAVISTFWIFLTVFSWRSWFFWLSLIGIFVVGTLIIFIYGLVKLIKIKSHIKQTEQRNIPEIDWRIEELAPSVS